MNTELIIKDKRGTIRIIVTLWLATYSGADKKGNYYRYDILVWHKPPKKKTEVLSTSIATDKEILDAKMEFWNAIKPTL